MKHVLVWTLAGVCLLTLAACVNPDKVATKEALSTDDSQHEWLVAAGAFSDPKKLYSENKDLDDVLGQLFPDGYASLSTGGSRRSIGGMSEQEKLELILSKVGSFDTPVQINGKTVSASFSIHEESAWMNPATGLWEKGEPK